MFEGFAHSAVGARGMMQIMPETGQEIASILSWPESYSAEDLYQPYINLQLGASYLARQVELFDGDLVAALASYNGGPGNALEWKSLAENDPDLFLEVVRFAETRTYLMQIYEFYQIYRRLYGVDS